MIGSLDIDGGAKTDGWCYYCMPRQSELYNSYGDIMT